MYIVLEGMDCTGKTTLAKSFAALLRKEGYNVLHLHEPYKNTKDQLAIRQLITDSNLRDDVKGLLALASRVELFKSKIEPALEQDRIVICERSFISTLVYQGGDNPEQLAEVHQTAFNALECEMYPDVVVFLENTHKEFVERIRNRGDQLDGIEVSLLSKPKFDKLKSAYENAVNIAVNLSDSTTKVLTGVNTAEGLFKALFK